MDEFDLIKKYFAPLAKDYAGSLGLSDDAALVDIPPGQELVVTKDAISAGVHFIGDEDAALIAKKLLRVNLSDLAAMGATPLCYFLALMLPKNTGEEWIQRFAEGLDEDQKQFAIHLGGGDTTATDGPLCLALTALGVVKKGNALKRSGAKAGDHIYVSGTIGDAALGLLVMPAKAGIQKRPDPGFLRDDILFLQQRYLLPEPRLALGQKLRGIASAAIDISDGLMQDLGHICAASNVGAVIERKKIPLSPAAKNKIDGDKNMWDCVLSGGDDYELLVTVPPEKAALLAHWPLTPIGLIQAGGGVQALDDNGKPIAVKPGFKHFS